MTGGRTLLCIVVGILSGTATPVARGQDRQTAFEPTLSQRLFGPADGLPAVPVYQAMTSRDGTLWLATGAGPYSFDGRQWRLLELPDSIQARSVRAMAETADGALWFGTHDGILRFLRERWTLFSEHEGVPIATVFAILRSGDVGDSSSVIAATDSGLLRLESGRFVRLPMPPMDSTGLMISSGSSAEQFWVAALRGWTASYDRGRWRSWRLGDGGTAIVNQVVAAPDGDTLEALAAASRGVLALHRGTWRQLMHTSAVVTRVLRIRVRNRYETWVGTEDGLLLRNSIGTRWDTLVVGGRQSRSAVQMLAAMDHGLGDGIPTVYAGYRSGYLVRFRIGPASTLPLPREIASAMIVSLLPLANGSLLASVNGGGTVHVGSATRLDHDRQPQSLQRLTTVTRDGNAETFALDVDDQRLVRWDRHRWRPEYDLPDRNATFIADGVGPDGVPTALVASNSALWYRRQPRWERWNDAPPGEIVDIATDSIAGALWVLHATALWRHAGGHWESFGRADGLPNAPLTKVRLQSLASGERLIWVGSLGAGAALARMSDAPPHRTSVTASRTPGLLSDDVSDLVVAPHDRVFLATSRGVVRFGVASGANPADLVVEDSYSDRDGLPHPHALTLAMTADGKRLWIGTMEGIASLPADAGLPLRRDERLTLTVRQLYSGAPLSGSAILAHDSADVEVIANYPTYHREADSRFRFQLISEDDAPQPSWQESNTLALRSLGTGNYRLRVWARDWRGDTAGPVDVRWRVAPPRFTGPWALATYAVILGALLAAAYRRRVRSLRQRAEELRANERRLAASEARFRSLFDSGGEAQFLVNNGRVVAANPAAHALLGVDDSIVRSGRELSDFVPDLSSIPIELSGAALPVPTGEAIAASGERIPVAIRRTRIAGDLETLEHVRLRDLRIVRQLERERAQLEDQLRRSQRMESLGTLAGGVAHDFNNLLAIIRANADLGRMDPADRPAIDEAFEAIQNASDRGRDLVSQILMFSRRRASAREPVSLRRLIHEIRPMLRASIPTTVALIIDDDATDDLALGDASQLHQMVLNLAANAEYAMRDQTRGQLTIGLRTIDVPGGTELDHGAALPGRYVCLSVTDTGTGMTPDAAIHLFEPFFTTKPRGKGTGLGLATIYGVVKQNGGSVEVYSEEGKGTTFKIYLPRVTGEAKPLLDLEARNLALGQETILLVEDEQVVRDLANRFLNKLGYHVLPHANAGDALLAARNFPGTIHLLMTDVVMPGMNGPTLAEELLKFRPDIKVLFASGYTEDAIVSHGMLSQGVQFIGKPYSIHALAQKLRDVLEVSRSAETD